MAENNKQEKKEREVLNISISIKEEEIEIVPLDVKSSPPKKGDELLSELERFTVNPQKGSCTISVTGDLDEVKGVARSILKRARIRRPGYRMKA